MADRQEWIVHNGRVTRRTVLKGAAGALGIGALLAACGSDNKKGAAATTAGGSGTTATTAAGGSGTATTAAGGSGTATTAAGGSGTTAASSGGGIKEASELAALLGVTDATSGKGMSIQAGAVLALTGPGAFYGKTMQRGLDLAAKHIEAAGGPKITYLTLDHKSGDAAAGQAAITELGTKKVPMKFASYVDDLGAMLAGTEQYKIFTLDGGGGTSIFGQGKPYFWGTRAITPNDPMPGLFKYTKETLPKAKTVGFMGWDVGEQSNAIIKTDILKKIADGGYEHNGLYELVPVGGQDFSQVIPKLKANEPDILLVSIYGQDPGSFANQAATAGIKSATFNFEFTPDGVKASKGSYDDGFTFAYDYFDPATVVNPLAKFFVSEFKKEYGEDPDFYAANFYENAFVLWECIRRVLKSGGDIQSGEALDKALQENLTVVSVYGGDKSTPGTYTLDPKTHSVVKRDMGIFEFKGGAVTAKAFFGIGGEGYRKA